jgi:PhnB protein
MFALLGRAGRAARSHPRKETATSFDTYLSFEGNCREAFTFYAELLGGRITAMLPFGDAPGCGGASPAPDAIMHGCLELQGRRLMGADRGRSSAAEGRKPEAATDATPDSPYRGVRGAQVVLNVPDAAEAERVYAALAEGGRIEMPLQETFWATRYGILVDRFGVPWMVNCERAQWQQVAA